MKVALGVEYNGHRYHGWQRQQSVIGVQQVLEEALTKVANEPIQVVCAGRTDAGVHATGQVVHFEHNHKRDMRAWKLGVNSNLPEDVVVRWAKPVGDDFHARFSATARRYRYVVWNQPHRTALLPEGITIIRDLLCEHRMQEAAQLLVGKHDFSSFRAQNCQSHSPVRTMTQVNVSRINEFVMLDITGNAFLHHMVRNIMGSLLLIGKGEKPVSWMQQLLDVRDRPQAGPTAKPFGLYLVDVGYPEVFQIPSTPLGPLFIPD